MQEAKHTIGEIAAAAGLNTSAIRYYEAEGLLPEPTRVAGQRRYDDGTLPRLGIIDTAKRAGFSLDEIRTLLDSVDAGDPAHRQLGALAAVKLTDVDALIARAEQMRRWLSTAAGCECSRLDDCRLFESEAARATDPPSLPALVQVAGRSF